MEVLGYLLSPFFDDNDELLGIEIIAYSFLSLFFFFFFSFPLFYKRSPTPYLGTMNLEKR
jgi:hypothetical protein